jgi:hypothetical protein
VCLIGSGALIRWPEKSKTYPWLSKSDCSQSGTPRFRGRLCSVNRASNLAIRFWIRIYPLFLWLLQSAYSNSESSMNLSQSCSSGSCSGRAAAAANSRTQFQTAVAVSLARIHSCATTLDRNRTRNDMGSRYLSSAARCWSSCCSRRADPFISGSRACCRHRLRSSPASPRESANPPSRSPGVDSRGPSSPSRLPQA